MNTILRTLTVNLLWILFFLFVVTASAQARNEYLNDGTNSCDQGSWEAYTEVRQHEYKSGNNDESQNQTLGFRFRKSIGPVCDEEFAEEQRLKQKLKTQLELVKECKRVPRINPPPVEFAELININNATTVSTIFILLQILVYQGFLPSNHFLIQSNN